MAETLADDTTSTAILIAPELGAAEKSVRVPRMGLMRVERASSKRRRRLMLMLNVLEGMGRISTER